MAVCEAIDKAIKLDHEEQHALKDLRKGVDSLKSDTLVYKVLLNAMENNTGLSGHSLYTRFIQRYVIGLRSNSYAHRANNIHDYKQDGKEAMGNLERALMTTLVLLQEDPAGNRHEVTMNPSGNKRSKIALHSVLDVLKANSRPGHGQELNGNLKVATYEIFVCQQNNERAFKLIWYSYVVNQQWTSRLSIDNIGNPQDRVWGALDSLLDTFCVHPFAVSPERVYRLNSHIFAILNQNHEAATRHARFARQIGKAWMDDRIPKYNVQIPKLGALQTSVFEFLWSGTVEHLKRDGPYSPDHPERPEFERAVEELEIELQEAILRSKKPHFSIALCGMVNSGKSLFLNALIGLAILPTDGRSHHSRSPYPILIIVAELLPTAWPCRLRHVEGQSVPGLQFEAEPFIVALKKLRAHQYGRKMQTYQPPPENMFEAPLSDAPSEPSEEETLLKAVHSQWVNLHDVTRENLLMFEAPGFELPRVAIGEQHVKILVSFVSCWTALCSTECYFLLGQLNDIVRLCQRFDLKLRLTGRCSQSSSTHCMVSKWMVFTRLVAMP